MVPARRSRILIFAAVLMTLFAVFPHSSLAADSALIGGSYIFPQQEVTTVVHEIMGAEKSVTDPGSASKTLDYRSTTQTISFNAAPNGGTAANMTELQARIQTNMLAYKTSFGITYTGDTTNLTANINSRLNAVYDANPELNFRAKTAGYSYSGVVGNVVISFAFTYYPATTLYATVSDQTALTTAIETMLASSNTGGAIRYTADYSGNWSTAIGGIISGYLLEAGNDYRHYTIKTYSYSYRPGMHGGVLISMTFSYWETAAQSAYVSDRVDQILPSIIDAGMTQEQKVKAINDYIVLTTAYDTTLKEHSAYASVYGGKTVCQGYALLAYKMLTEAGLNARIIEGNAGGAHAWNLVQINDAWYHLDCTWNDPVPDVKGRISYQYFALSDDEISSSRTWNTDAGYPVCPSAYSSSDADLNRGYRLAAINGINILKATTNLNIGGNETLQFELNPSTEVYMKATWLSTNPTIASVDANGTIKGLKIGTTTIVATTVLGNKSDYCQVTVKPVLVMGLTLDKETNTIGVGNSDTLTATLTSNATDTKVLWKSSSPAIAAVDAYGKVKGVKVGTAVITATSNDGKYTDSCTVTVSAVPVTGITLDSTSASIEIGGTKNLKATLTPANATNKLLTWTSNNAAVASVASNGAVKALAVGTATITATAQDGSGQTADCAITVTAKAKGVSLDQVNLTLDKGGSKALAATIPAGATGIACKSSNNSIATAALNSENSILTVTVPSESIGGTAVITLSAKVGTVLYTATCSVLVPNRVSGVTVNPTAVNMAPGTKKTLAAVISPTNAGNKLVTWSTSNAGVATVDSKGNVTAVAAGTANITVTTDDSAKTAACAITVANIEATGLTLTPVTLNMKTGEIKPLTAAVVPATTTSKTVTWTTSDADVATVDSGKVTAVAEGTATITATLGSLSKTCTVKVAPGVSVTGIKLDKTTLALTTGQTGQLKATLAPLMPANNGISWKSDNEAAATVTCPLPGTCVVTAVGPGSAWITATSDDNTAKSAKCLVTVVQRVSGVSLDQTLIEELNVGGSVTLLPTISPGNATNQTVSWSSSNAAAAAVSKGGTVTGKAPGVATITVTTLDGKYTAICRVVVLPVLVTGVTLDQHAIDSLKPKGTMILTAVIGPDNASNKKVTWSSSAPTIVSVANGKITALKVGTAIIKVTTADGQFSDTCEVTVKQ